MVERARSVRRGSCRIFAILGMVPFHPSLYAWVRERSDHAEMLSGRFFRKSSFWLANDAPEYWRWGWLWLARARKWRLTQDLIDRSDTGLGPLISLAKGPGPNRQIEKYIECCRREKVFADGDYPSTLALRSLRTRVSKRTGKSSRVTGRQLWQSLIIDSRPSTCSTTSTASMTTRC